MSFVLTQGGKTNLPASAGAVVITHASDPAIDVDLAAFLLKADGKVTGDEGLVFFNQPRGPGGVATYSPPRSSGGATTHRLGFDLSRLPAGITRVAVTLTEANGPGFAAVRDLRGRVECGGQVFELAPPAFQAERGVIALDLYVHQGKPKVGANWQGSAEGLGGLCRLFGVEVAEEAPAPPPAPRLNLEKVSGRIDLAKGSKPVLIDKTPLIVASISWPSSTDYDVYALVMSKDGRQVDVATFGAEGVPPLRSYGGGAVEHTGDVRRSGGDLVTESLKIRLTDAIVAVVPVAYSAQSNGTGSFREYRVSMVIDNQKGAVVTIPAPNANDNRRIYTCVPGMIRNTPHGVVIEALELYSKPNSENRPKLKLQADGSVRVLMDKGPKNDFK